MGPRAARRGLPVAIATPRARQGRRAPRGFATTGSDVFHLPSEGGVGPGCEVPPQPAGRERAGSRVTETPGKSRLPAVVAHNWAVTMALLLRFVLLCGVAGEWGTDRSLGSLLPGQPWGARCLRPPGNNEAWRRGRARFGGAAAVVEVRAELHRGDFAGPGARAPKVGGAAGRGALRAVGYRGCVGVGDRAPGCGAAVERAPRARVGGRGVPAAPGVSPRLFFAAGAGFALFALALSLVSRGVVSIGVTRFQKPWAASFQVSSSPSQETELQTP